MKTFNKRKETLEMAKKFGLYAKKEEKVVLNMTKLRRNSRKRSTPRRFK
jgi:hypothetical protein